tara:strand:+ start:725 stop:856 length:132 start_codon:yes stop_codon:yes gene_type:complete
MKSRSKVIVRARKNSMDKIIWRWLVISYAIVAWVVIAVLARIF